MIFNLTMLSFFSAAAADAAVVLIIKPRNFLPPLFKLFYEKKNEVIEEFLVSRLCIADKHWWRKNA